MTDVVLNELSLQRFAQCFDMDVEGKAGIDERLFKLLASSPFL